MKDLRFLDFDLMFLRTANGYRVQSDSPAGQASVEFVIPFSDLEIENFLLHFGRARQPTRRRWSPQTEVERAFGGRLFAATFTGEVRSCLRSSINDADRQDAGLRIRLRLAEAPELNDLPWEFLCDPELGRFLALSAETPLVRYLGLSERVRPLVVKLPLEVLAVISSPTDCAPFDMEAEWRKLQESLAGWQERGLLFLSRLESPTLTHLRRWLRQRTCHILHFIGHGGFNPETDNGLLLFTDEDGRRREVTGQTLGTLLHDHHPLRLAVLNACEGARTSRTDPFAGVAQSLVQQGIPAVAAMPFEISDQATITFAYEFYAAVVDGYPVDAAMAEARKALFMAGHELAWGVPMLYMRSPDGRIFDIHSTASAMVETAPSETKPPPLDADGTHKVPPATVTHPESLRPPTAFTMPGSPPRVFISYSHDSPEHKDRVLKLCDQLRTDGIDAWIDQYEISPPEGWPRWCAAQVREADFILVVCSEMYERRFRGAEEPGRGLGVTWEGYAVVQELYEAGSRNTKFIPVVLSGGDPRHIPDVLRGATRYDLGPGDEYWSLYRHLTGQPGTVAPPLGVRVALSRQERRTDRFFHAPEPRYEDDRIKGLSEALESAYQRLENEATSGEDTTNIREEILRIRRKIRDGPRLQAGDFLSNGRFKLIEVLGQGGFATVWKAFDRTRHELVAVKVLHGQHAEDRSRRERFLRGAREMARLRHPGIVRVAEENLEDGGHYFFVMEHLTGGDLRRAVNEGKIGREAAFSLVHQVGEALHFAHQQGVVHRDVKPANILLDAAGRPKLSDFDLARAADTTAGTTRLGALGTLLYAAPEALETPGEAGVAADVYSLAMTGVFCLYGKELPAKQVMRNHEAFISGLQCPPRVGRALAQALAWEPEARFGSVLELLEALKESTETVPQVYPEEFATRFAIVNGVIQEIRIRNQEGEQDFHATADQLTQLSAAEHHAEWLFTHHQELPPALWAQAASDLAEFYGLLGWVKHKEGQLAVEKFNKTIQPGSGEARRLLESIQKSYRDSDRWLDKSLALDPINLHIRDLRERHQKEYHAIESVLRSIRG